MAMEAGAELANMRSFWGQPAIFEPGFEIDGRAVPQMGSVRSCPGVLVVNRAGRRFVNEGSTYQDFPKVLTAYDPVAIEYPNEQHWIVFDQRVKDSNAILPSVLPGTPAPEWITQAPTIAALAAGLGIDPAGLADSVERWNADVGAGADSEFRRGTIAFEAHMSGHSATPAGCMAVFGQPPFYGVELRNGTLGTSGGPRIDGDGRVRGPRGAIPGLYAAGNAAACVFGLAYPGGGATIGPAMTFGYLAGRHAAAQPRRDI